MVSIGSMDEGLAVLERERRDERREGMSEKEKEEYLISERKNGADSSILMVNISFSFYHAMGVTATEKKHHHLSTFLLSFVLIVVISFLIH